MIVLFKIVPNGLILTGRKNGNGSSGLQDQLVVLLVGIKNRTANLAVIDSDLFSAQLLSHVVYNAATGTAQAE